MGPERLTRVILALGAGASLALLPGCGGDDDADALTRTEFVQAATTICNRAEHQATMVDPPGSPAEAVTYAERSRDILTNMRDDFDGLPPVRELEGPLDHYLEALDEDIAVMEDLQEAAEAGDTDRIQELFRTEINEDAGRIAADELNVDACAGAANAIAKTP